MNKGSREWISVTSPKILSPQNWKWTDSCHPCTGSGQWDPCWGYWGVLDLMMSLELLLCWGLNGHCLICREKALWHMMVWLQVQESLERLQIPEVGAKPISYILWEPHTNSHVVNLTKLPGCEPHTNSQVVNPTQTPRLYRWPGANHEISALSGFYTWPRKRLDHIRHGLIKPDPVRSDLTITVDLQLSGR